MPLVVTSPPVYYQLPAMISKVKARLTPITLAFLIGITFCSVGTADTGVWTRTGQLSLGRTWHTATLLPNGKVLVTGGDFTSFNGPDVTASAEVYDTDDGTWTPTGSLAQARRGHTATLLPSGKVLVTGGNPPTSSTPINLTSAELYDPVTGTWTSTGSLSVGRSWHTATLLPNGKVLVTGGFGNSNYVATTELYDPATAVWTTTGSLGAGRAEHLAALLPNGTVLVTGGKADQGAPEVSAEIYDTAAGFWTTTGPLITARDENPTATVLPNGKLFVTGGYGSGGTLASAELYDPATARWTAAASLAMGRYWHTATLLPNGRVLIVGGRAGGFPFGSSVGSAEVYDPAADSWAGTGSPAMARLGHTATLLPTGKVLVAGGSADGSAELFDPQIPPSFAMQPVGNSFSVGQTLVLSATVSGTPPLTYQWQFNGTNIPGATGASLTLTNLTALHAGAYRLTVSNAAGTNTSAMAELFNLGDLKLLASVVLAGPIGRQFRVDYADVVTVGTTNWITLTNMTLPYSPFLVVDPSSAGRTQRYYRAVPVP